MMELGVSMQQVTVSCLFLVYVRKACGCVNKPSPLGPKPDTAGGGNWQAERRKLKGALVRLFSFPEKVASRRDDG